MSLFDWHTMNGWALASVDFDGHMKRWTHPELFGVVMTWRDDCYQSGCESYWMTYNARGYNGRSVGGDGSPRENGRPERCARSAAHRFRLWAECERNERARYEAMLARPRLQIVSAAVFGYQDHHVGMYGCQQSPDASAEWIAECERLAGVLKKMK